MKPTLKQFIHMHCLSDKRFLTSGGITYSGLIPDIHAVRLPVGFHEVRQKHRDRTKIWFSKIDRAILEYQNGAVLIIQLPNQETFDEFQQSAGLPCQQVGDGSALFNWHNITIVH